MLRAWLLLSNTTMMMGWARVLRLIYRNFDAIQDERQSICLVTMTPDLILALMLSFLEFFNAMAGITRSKPHQVLLFALIRTSVELLAAPLMPCSAWQHILTVTCWSIGDTIRFGCFVLDSLVPEGRVAKLVRYTIGPILFPIGAAGEMLMILKLAVEGRPYLYVAAALWPVGFYPLMKQLLKQRKKYLRQLKEKTS